MRFRSRAYGMAGRAETWVVAAGRAVHRGAWLGLLDHHDLHDVDRALYDGDPVYQDEAYLRGGLFAWEDDAVSACFPPAGHLLVTGAGAGREVLALARRGYEVTAYECHPALLARGRQLLDGVPGVELHAVERDVAPTAGGPYDGAVVGWSSYMLVPGRDRRIAFLRDLARVLRPGAPVLVSFFSRHPDHGRLRLLAGVGGAVRRARRAEPVELGDDLAPNYVHRFTREEIVAELAAGGFATVRASDEGPARFDSGFAVGRLLPTKGDAW